MNKAAYIGYTVEKENILGNTKLILTYKGMDRFDRPVYEDENGRLWKDVDPRPWRKADLCTSNNNEFDGEPDINMLYIKKYENVQIEFVPERVTW